jgi:hypothetical protein
MSTSRPVTPITDVPLACPAPSPRGVSVTPRSCRAPPLGAPQTPRTAGDPDAAACCPLPDYALHGTLLIWSTLQAQHGLPSGRRLITLRHSALYIAKLLKTERDAEWQAAMEALVLVTKDGGSMLMARIGMMQDAALQIADAVQTRKIGRRPKSPVILFGPELYFD